VKIIFTLLVLLFVANAKASGSRDSLPAGKATREALPEKSTAVTKSTGIVMRCARTSMSAEPLLVIDGLPVDFKELKTLNPDDIESITILKDAYALAIYGSRAAEGVILITSKRDPKQKFIVKDFLTGDVIPRATICFTNGGETIKTVANDDGIVVTDKLNGGIKYHVSVSSTGYKTFSTIVEGRQQEIRLERDVKACPTVVISSTEYPRTIHCGMSVVVTREQAVPIKGAITVKPVYPNPVLRSNIFNLDYETELGGTIQLSVISINGGIVLFQSQKASKGLNHFSITADAKWSAGIYNIQLRNEKGTLVRQEKLIVQ
jgi:TonB-dependent SusC/RagA subfamily outer membrane receptor